jgi:hypothetical protein
MSDPNVSINDNLPHTRPGWVVVIGAVVIVVGVLAIMVFKTTV